MATKTRVPNRLANEKSPYLLQHQHNPVDWFPWGEDAFAKAKAEDKPIFLSIGYSACHWCHVMERESFQDEEVAELLNREFVCVKVDREERPDVDAVYMDVCQALTGQGGWPLTVLTAPDQTPFFAGTYFPKHARFGSQGLLDILEALAAAWKSGEREQILETGKKLVEAIQNRKRIKEGEMSRELFAAAREALNRRYDRAYGGFGTRPKFPMPHQILFLLRVFALNGDRQALSMAEGTLLGLYRGGIFDHVGFGFSRYSTDERWLVPHFEKMLYDNALLAIAYLEAFQTTGRKIYRRVAEKILLYVRREMTGPYGGFYSAQDADSDGEEGRYYLFSPEEATHVLGEDDGRYFCDYYGITREGNFEGKSIPSLIGNGRFEEPDARIDELNAGMLEFRVTRRAPDKDDKVLTAWNGLMISAFARAYRILGEEEYLEQAMRAIRFLRENLMDKGLLKTSYRDGRTSGGGILDDYAFVIWGLLELYEAGYDPIHLREAIHLCQTMVELFWDEQAGGFYLSGRNNEKLILRPKEAYDGALPSGNSAAAYVLGRLARMTGDPALEELYARQLLFLAQEAESGPAACCFGLIAAVPALFPFRELVCVAKGEAERELFLSLLRKNPLHSCAVVLVTPETKDELGRMAEFTAACSRRENKMTLYICENNTCSLPVTDPERMEKILSGTDV